MTSLKLRKKLLNLLRTRYRTTYLFISCVMSICHFLLAELQRAKRASETPWVRKVGNPSSQENLVMTSAYERPCVRPYRLGGRGRGISRSSIRETNKSGMPSFLGGFLSRKVRKTLISICHVDKRSERLI